MKYFVCSDIHGFYTEWMTALKNSGFDKDNPEHKIIFWNIMCEKLIDVKKRRGERANEKEN